jgi:MFS family permease
MMGMFTLLGQVAGAKLAPLLLPSADPPSLNLSLLGLVLTGALLVGGAVTLAGVREGPLPSSGGSHPFFEGLRKNPAFQLLLLARFLTNIGFYAPYPFLQYYVQHSLGVPAQSAAQQLGVLLLYAIAAGLVGTVAVGKLADKYDRISLLVATNAVFCVGLTGLIFARNPQQVAPWAFLFGLGLGGFMAVDWALAAQLVPRKHPAEAMAFWAITFVVAQSLGSGVAGWALSAAKPHVGDDASYRWLFAFAMVFVFLGLLPFVRIRKMLRKGLVG